MMIIKKPLAITPGEPAGIGPDLVVQLAHEKNLPPCIVIADPNLLAERAKQLKIKIDIQCIQLNKPFENKSKGLAVLPVELIAPCKAGELNEKNAAYVLETLKVAAKGCLNQDFSGVVTAPVHKGIINTAGIPFKGHTEFFADIAGVSQVVMMLASKKLRVALATTHLPLSEVPKAITASNLETTLRILQKGLINQFGLSNPKMLVCGLNPHAGEGGYLGHEEIDIIQPVIQKLISERFDLEGPLPADTIFTPKYLDKADAVLAMYHDQGLPVIKHAAFGEVINITLGLPFIRASVDHGTALDLAGMGKASATSLKAAIHWTYYESHSA